jgi:CheY-like chemotaxis protein
LEKTGQEVTRVLVVDDEPEILQLFARMLSMTWPECQILQAMNGRRALQLLRSRKPDIILLDLIMPGMDGYQMLHEKSLDESIRDIPVIVITSKTPSGETIISDALTITRGDGLSLNELLVSIQNVSKILVPSTRITDRELTENPGEKQAF